MTKRLFHRGLAIGIGVGIAATVPAVLLAIISGGAGHGNYLFAKLLFPLPMLLTLLTNDTISPLSIFLALAQFPLYGGVLGWYAADREAQATVAVLIFLFHAAAVAASAFLLSNFS